MKSEQLEKLEVAAVVRVDDVMVLIIGLFVLSEIMESSLYEVYSYAENCSPNAVCVVWKGEIAGLNCQGLTLLTCAKYFGAILVTKLEQHIKLPTKKPTIAYCTWKTTFNRKL